MIDAAIGPEKGKEWSLFESLKEAKAIHMVLTPVHLIELAWKWEKQGLITQTGDDIMLSAKGLELLNRHNSKT